MGKFRYSKNSGATWTVVDAVLPYTINARPNEDVIVEPIGPATTSSKLTSITPLFVDNWNYTKSHLTASDFSEATIVSRDSATQMTLASGHGSRIPALGGAIAVRNDATGRVVACRVKSVSGDVVQVIDDLPASISICQQMHDATNGQHLSRLAYKGMADHIVDQIAKYADKDTLIWEYNPAICGGSAGAITYTLDGVAKTISTRLLGSAGNSGFVTGTTTLAKLCGQQGDINIGNTVPSWLARTYLVQDGVAGNGVSIAVPIGGKTGFAEIGISARRTTYNTSLTTEGRARLQVLADGVSIIDKTYRAGELYVERVEFTGATALEIRMTCADAAPSSLQLHGVQVYESTLAGGLAGIFKSGDVLAFFGDSWFEYPVAGGGETPLPRADGSTSTGLQYVSERVRQRLADDGITVTTLNMGRSGQTSKWGNYWLDTVMALSPKPSHVLLHFAINDNNSVGNVAGSTASVYDFSPSNMWAAQLSSAGGVFGSTTYDEWLANMLDMVSRLIAEGIQPVIISPPVTASSARAQTMQRTMLSRLWDGFNGYYVRGGAPAG